MHRSWRLRKRPGERMPAVDDFELRSEPLTLRPAANEVLLRNRFLSVDPYMRWRMNDAKSYAAPVAIGQVMVGATVSEVIESDHPDFKPVDSVVGPGGWQSHSLVKASQLRKIDTSQLPASTFLAALGSPGFTAWAGLRHIGKPKAGETLVVGAATGPVGSIVGQLARAAGARAVGICGGAEKVTLARDEFGFDAALDHRDPDLAAKLAEACPDGVDVYFENIGGKVLEAVRPLINDFARIPVCGLIAQYNVIDDAARLAPLLQEVLVKRLTIRGFIVTDFQADFGAFQAEMTPMVISGKIRCLEDVREGLEGAPQAFIDMLGGGNRGKMIVALD